MTIGQNFKIGSMLGRLSSKYNLPLQSFPVDTWEEEFINAADIGFDCLEWVEDGFSDLQNPFFTLKGRKEIMKLQKIFRVEVNSICAHSFISGGLSSSEDHLRNESIKKLQLIINHSNDLGISRVIIPLMESASISSKKDLVLFKDSINKIFFPNLNLKILFETDFNALNCLNFFKNFNKKNIGIVFDLGNASQLNYDLYKDISDLHHLIGEIHIKDKDLSQSTRLGEGNTNFINGFRALRDCKWHGDFILETPIFSNWEEEARHNFSFAKKLVDSFKNTKKTL